MAGSLAGWLAQLPAPFFVCNTALGNSQPLSLSVLLAGDMQRYL